MSTIRDLRDTLEQHAQGLHDAELVGRAAAVQGRVQVVRRRRTAAAIGSVAAVVAVVTAAVAVPGPDRGAMPSGPVLAGEPAPETMSALGFTYGFVTGVEGTGQVSLDLRDQGDEPFLVTWATADADEVRVRHLGRTRREGGDDFVGHLLVDPAADQLGPVTVRADGEVALAVYRLDRDRPAPGVTHDGITLRAQLAGDRLIDATIGELGATSVETTVTYPPGHLGILVGCAGVPEGLVVVEELGGKPVSWGECAGGDELPFDLAAAPESYSRGVRVRGVDPEPGDEVRLRYWIGTEQGGLRTPVPVEEAPGARLAIAGYEVGGPAQDVGDLELDASLERDGSTWRLVGHTAGEPGARSVEAEAPVRDRPVLVMAGVARGSTGTATLLRDGEPVLRHTNGISDGGTLFALDVSEDEPGHVYEIRSASMWRPQSRPLLAFYERMD